MVAQEKASTLGVETVLTDTVPSDQRQRPKVAKRQPKSSSDPPVYPIPSDRSAKSASTVPNVVEATIVAQYSVAWKRLARICATTSATSAPPKIVTPIRYPQFSSVSAWKMVIVTVSPPGSPNVVAKILMTQKPRVTAGTLVNVCFATSFIR